MNVHERETLLFIEEPTVPGMPSPCDGRSLERIMREVAGALPTNDSGSVPVVLVSPSPRHVAMIPTRAVEPTVVPTPSEPSAITPSRSRWVWLLFALLVALAAVAAGCRWSKIDPLDLASKISAEAQPWIEHAVIQLRELASR